jgi:UDP-N-acetyl-D-mannosaminuronic acid transferase (WecB/TagA/CpsF family)
VPSARPRTTDLTGRTRLEQQKAHAEELAERANEIAVAAAYQAEQDENAVLDYSAASPVIIDAVAAPIEVSEEWRVIRTNEDLEDVTIGVNNVYTFTAGQKTKVPAWVADHLEEKGYVWH